MARCCSPEVDCNGDGLSAGQFVTPVAGVRRGMSVFPEESVVLLATVVDFEVVVFEELEVELFLALTGLVVSVDFDFEDDLRSSWPGLVRSAIVVCL